LTNFFEKGGNYAFLKVADQWKKFVEINQGAKMILKSFCLIRMKKKCEGFVSAKIREKFSCLL